MIVLIIIQCKKFKLTFNIYDVYHVKSLSSFLRNPLLFQRLSIFGLPQLTFTYSKSTIETLEEGVKYVQS